MAFIEFRRFALETTFHLLILILSIVIRNLLAQIHQFVEFLGIHRATQQVIDFFFLVKVLHLLILEILKHSIRSTANNLMGDVSKMASGHGENEIVGGTCGGRPRTVLQSFNDGISSGENPLPAQLSGLSLL